MAVAIQDIQNWSAVGTKDAMARTYAAVQLAIEASDELKKHNIEIFLQGSYANATNIRGDSDVDVVVMLKSSWVADKTHLTASEKQAYDNDHHTASYGPKELRHDIINALNAYFGTDRVEPRNKAIRVNKKDSYVDADVVPAVQHRLYTKYDSITKGRFVEGTKLHPPKGHPIVNFPKIHKMNGESKNAQTRNNFKPAVRQLKQLKRRAVQSGRVDAKKAPGYLVECMTYNAPDSLFVDDHHGRLMELLKWLMSADFSTFMAADSIHELFRTDPGNFQADEAKQMIFQLADEVTE